MKTLRSRMWTHVYGVGRKFWPSKEQVQMAEKFIQSWKVPVEWVVEITAHDPSKLAGVLPEDIQRMEISAIHPNVPKSKSSFYLENSVRDRSRADWRWR